MTAFKAGQRVREIAPPRRKGTVFKVVRSGTYARVYVRIDGRPIVAFYPAQITLG